MPGASVTLQPTTIDEVQQAVLYAAPGLSPEHALRPVGGGTKTALSTPAGDDLVLDLRGLAGVTEYQPDECTFTALAGTPVAEVEAMLAPHRQGLPFEPPFASRGATLGGTVAAAVNGPGRFRYGGVRDFLIGARFVDGEGRLLRTGGRVVKNAAGFHFHHLLLGSFGRLGVIVELTFKVFPAPKARTTLVARYGTVVEALDGLARLRAAALDLDALDLDGSGALAIRIAGEAAALPARAAGVSGLLTGGTGARPDAIAEMPGAEADRYWADARDCAWAGGTLARVALTPGRIPELEARLSADAVRRRYSAGGEVVWIDWPGEPSALDALLVPLGLSGMLVLGDGTRDPLLGVRPDAAFLARVRETLDPRHTFSAAPFSTVRSAAPEA